MQVGKALDNCSNSDVRRVLDLASTGTKMAAGLSQSPGSAGDYMLAFGSSGGEPVIIGKQPVFEKHSRIRFSSGQSIGIEVDRKANTLKVYIDGNLEVIARNIDEGKLIPYICIRDEGSAAITRVTSLITNNSIVLNDFSGEIRSHAFDNTQWTYQMDTLLLSLGGSQGMLLFDFVISMALKTFPMSR